MTRAPLAPVPLAPGPRRLPSLLLGCGVAMLPSLAAADPSDPGPFEVNTDAYDFGDEAFSPVNLTGPVELRAAVYSPQDLSAGPFPIVLLLHGRHTSCYDPENPEGDPNDGSVFGGTAEWPCAPGRIPIPSHEGYASLGVSLASHGMIVVSISANGISSFDNDSFDLGASARADLLNEHLVRWAQWNSGTPGPFDGRFEGAVDLEHVGAMGHSRGGEGVATLAAADVADGEPNFLDAALLVAPTNFNRTAFGEVNLGVVLPYCDGDVLTLEGVRYYDDARHLTPDDPAEKFSLTLAGANHNYFNTVWTPGTFVAGAFDDFDLLTDAFGPDPACSSDSDARISAVEQQDAFCAYATAFFRQQLAGEESFASVLRGDEVPTSAGPARPQLSYLASAQHHLLVNAVDTEASLATNALDGAVETDATAALFCGLGSNWDDPNTYDHCLDEVGMFNGNVFDARQPHTPGLGQLRLVLEDGQRWTNALPAGTDASGFAHLSVRLAPDFETTSQSACDLAVVLEDHQGNTAEVLVDAYSDALRPAEGAMENILPRKLLHSARVPLEAFEGIELSDLAAVSLEARAGAGAEPLGFMVSDLGFMGEAELPPDTGSSTGSASESGDLETTTGSDTLDAESSTTAPMPESGTGGDTTGGDTGGADEDAGGCGCQQRRGPTGPAGALGHLGLLGLLFGGFRLSARRRRDR